MLLAFERDTKICHCYEVIHLGKLHFVRILNQNLQFYFSNNDLHFTNIYEMTLILKLLQKVMQKIKWIHI